MGCYLCGAEDAPHETVTKPRLRACAACYERLMSYIPASGPPPCDGCGAPFGAGCSCPENKRAIGRGERRKADRGE